MTGTGGNASRPAQSGASRRRRGRSGQGSEAAAPQTPPRDVAQPAQQPAQTTTEKSRSSRGRQTPSAAAKDRSGTKTGTARNPAARTSSGRNPSGRNPSTRSADRPAVTHAQTATGAGKKQPLRDGEQPVIRVIPLGGMREIGKNMTVYECGDDMIIVDCGVAFPGEDQPGIDAVIPDMAYIRQNKERLRGVFLTHGHEDHIGSLPWLTQLVDVPIYGGRLPMELVRRKLEERSGGAGLDKLRAVNDGDVIEAGRMRVEFIHVNHSIPDAFSLAIFTPGGIVVHSGDFKVDYTPIDGGPINLPRLAEIGSMGVELLVCESTNIEQAGSSPSERSLASSFETIFNDNDGRIFVASFSSNIYRLQQVVSAAERAGRKVALVGRSMLNVFDAARSLGYMQMKQDTLIDISQIDRYDPDRICVLTTGSQGEPMSALTRMAFSEHRSVEIIAGDTVVLSADPIPGNEKSVYRVINELFKRGAHVIYEGLADIHVSGHAYLEEIKLYHQLVRPKYFLPAHGEYRHMYTHAQVANDLGQPWDTMLLLNNGDICECGPSGCKITGFLPAEGILIDGSGVGDIDSSVLRERKMLADEGVIVVSMVVEQAANRLAAPPDIQMRGFIFESEASVIERECMNRITSFVRKLEDAKKPLAPAIRGNLLRDQLRDLLYTRTRRRPTIILSLIELP